MSFLSHVFKICIGLWIPLYFAAAESLIDCPSECTITLNDQFFTSEFLFVLQNYISKDKNSVIEKFQKFMDLAKQNRKKTRFSPKYSRICFSA